MLLAKGGLLPCPITPLVLPTSLAKAMWMLMHCLASGGLKPLTLTQTEHAVCKGVQAPHGKVETLCQGSQAVDALCQDNAPPGMTPLQWCQAQAKDPAIHQIIDSIQNKTLKHLKIQGDMLSELKALIRLKKQLKLKQGVLCRRVTPADAKPRLQLILPPSHHNKAIEGCHDQVGHLGQDRVLELLRDQF